MSKLKPCPFCGSKNIGIQHMDKNDARIYQVYCIPCWANRGWFDTEEDAIAWWNKRKEDNE